MLLPSTITRAVLLGKMGAVSRRRVIKKEITTGTFESRCVQLVKRYYFLRTLERRNTDGTDQPRVIYITKIK